MSTTTGCAGEHANKTTNAHASMVPRFDWAPESLGSHNYFNVHVKAHLQSGSGSVIFVLANLGHSR